MTRATATPSISHMAYGLKYSMKFKDSASFTLNRSTEVFREPAVSLSLAAAVPEATNLAGDSCHEVVAPRIDERDTADGQLAAG